jgi:hypothetical protein
VSKFMLRRDANMDRSFLHVVNFLTACQIMSLEDARPLVRAFHLEGEDVVVDIPDALDSRFSDALKVANFQHKKI